MLEQRITDFYALYNGDCCEVIKHIPSNSVGLSVFSPPFSNLYIYSDSIADMGNCKDEREFFDHFKYLIPELFRVLIPGRLCCIHCKDLPKYANRDGAAGLKDFPGEIIRAFEEGGFTFHSRVTIWKCPVTERERTNNNGLLHKTATRDRSQLRQGMADYMIMMRKETSENLMSDEPVTNEDGSGFNHYIGNCDPSTHIEHPSPYARKKPAGGDAGRSIDIWRRYAEPVWWDINQQNVLNFKVASESKDEKHICPLQLDVIRRCIQIWSNEGDAVLSPFAGIGSEGVGAIDLGRRFIGIELKSQYFNFAEKYLNEAIDRKRSQDLFGDIVL